jgi:hypothetical protein
MGGIANLEGQRVSTMVPIFHSTTTILVRSKSYQRYGQIIRDHMQEHYEDTDLTLQWKGMRMVLDSFCKEPYVLITCPNVVDYKGQKGLSPLTNNHVVASDVLVGSPHTHPGQWSLDTLSLLKCSTSSITKLVSNQDP